MKQLEKMIALADSYEEEAAVLRKAMSILNRHNGQAAINGFSSKLNGAMKLRGYKTKRARRTRAQIETDNLDAVIDAAKNGHSTNGAVKGPITEQILAFLTAHPGPQPAHVFLKAIGVNNNNSAVYTLEKKGQVKKTAEGWVLTGAAPAKHGKADTPEYHSRQAQKARRLKTAKLLAGMSTTDPFPGPGMRTAVLVNTGYIKRKGDGYVRTEKEFTP